MALEDEVRRLAIAVETLTAKLFRVPKPGTLGVRVTAERTIKVGDETVDFLTFVVTVPAASGDVVKRNVAVTLPDGTVQTVEVAGQDVAEAGPFEVEQNAEVKVSCVNVDDAGNESEPRVQMFTIIDTIAPASPDELGVKVTGERTE